MLPVCADAEMDISNIPSLPDSSVLTKNITGTLSPSRSRVTFFAFLTKYRFVEESEHFCKEYDLDFKLEKEYGVEDPHIDVIQLNIDVNDFRAFSKVLNSGSDTSLGLHEWRAILGLSSQWFFNDVRQQAIASIDAIDMSLLERIEMAKEHHVSAWLLAGYRKLALRSEAITVEEAEKMDLQKAILVCGLREKYHGRGYCRSEIDNIVLTTFASDFDEIRVMEAKYPTKEERRVMEAERVKARAEEEAKVLARRESMIEEEARRQAAIEEYERQLEEQRANLLRLEREKERILNGNTECAPAPASSKKKKSKKGSGSAFKASTSNC